MPATTSVPPRRAERPFPFSMSTSPLNLTIDTPPAELLATVVPHLRIAHQIPGRVRFKMDIGALQGIRFDGQGATSDAISTVLKKIRGIRNISWNLLAKSCTVEYTPSVIPDAAWPDLLAGRKSPAADALQAILEETHANLRQAAAS